MFKGLGNLAQVFKQAQQLKGRMADMQQELGKLRADGQAGGGMVTVTVNGQQRVLGVRIEQSIFDSGDREMIEELVAAATNQAMDKAKEAAAAAMSNIAGGMPGFDEALADLTGQGGPGSDPSGQDNSTTPGNLV